MVRSGGGAVASGDAFLTQIYTHVARDSLMELHRKHHPRG
jgi:site-specific recombinase XerD